MILGAWFWHRFGPRIVTPFSPNRVSPASYDVSLGERVIFYRLYGLDLPGLEVTVKEDTFEVDFTGQELPNRVEAGDVFLAHTKERFSQPRTVSLSLYLKSSTARGFLEHLHAGWGEHGFQGTYTLEFRALVAGRLRPGLPIGQMVAHLTLGWHSYRDKRPKHYQGQRTVTPNRNKKALGWTPWWQDTKTLEHYQQKHGVEVWTTLEDLAAQVARRRFG